MMKIYRVYMLEYTICIFGRCKNTARVFLILQNILHEYDKTEFALGSK